VAQRLLPTSSSSLVPLVANSRLLVAGNQSRPSREKIALLGSMATTALVLASERFTLGLWLNAGVCGLAAGAIFYWLNAFGFRSVGESLQQRLGRAKLARAPLQASLAALAPGQRVRLVGVVLPGPSFTSAGERRDVVLAGYFRSLGGMRRRFSDASFRWELHGMDFTLALDTGAHVRVDVTHVRFLRERLRFDPSAVERRPLAVFDREDDEQGPCVASVHAEETVAVGESVEVLGVLTREVDPLADAGPRSAKLVLVLRGTRRRPLLVRRLAERKAIGVPASSGSAAGEALSLLEPDDPLLGVRRTTRAALLVCPDPDVQAPIVHQSARGRLSRWALPPDSFLDSEPPPGRGYSDHASHGTHPRRRAALQYGDGGSR
jgi:hypothetical protein